MLAAEQAALFQLSGLDAMNERPDDAFTTNHGQFARVGAAYQLAADEDAANHEAGGINAWAHGEHAVKVEADPASSRLSADDEGNCLVAASSSLSEEIATPQLPAESFTAAPALIRPVRRRQKDALPSLGAVVSPQKRSRQGSMVSEEVVRSGGAASRHDVKPKVADALPADDAPPRPGTRRII